MSSALPSVEDEQFQRHILQGVSRTFALTIPQLPAGLDRALARAPDTSVVVSLRLLLAF